LGDTQKCCEIRAINSDKDTDLYKTAGSRGARARPSASQLTTPMQACHKVKSVNQIVSRPYFPSPF